MREISVDCPTCKTKIEIPYFEKLKAQAEKEYDLAERSAQEELSSLRLWLNRASIFALIKFWLTGRLF